MILVGRYDNDTKELQLCDCSCEVVAYYVISNEIKNSNKVLTLKDNIIVTEDKKIECSNTGDVVDDFLKVAAKYEKAYFYDTYFTYLYSDNQFIELEAVPNVSFCKNCGKLVSDMNQGYCFDCYIECVVKKEIKSIYNNLEDYTPYENVTKMVDMYHRATNSPCNISKRVGKKIEEFIDEIFSKEKIPEEIREAIKEGSLA